MQYFSINFQNGYKKNTEYFTQKKQKINLIKYVCIATSQKKIIFENK